MHRWLEKFNETWLLEREDFYGDLNMKTITDHIARTQKEDVTILK